MSETGPEPDRDTSQADQEYFHAIEAAFVRLRGAPLLLSPADWRQAQEWRRDGIPLATVLEGLEEVFERRRQREAENLVSSLRYCRRAVRAAWKRNQDLEGLAQLKPAESLDVLRRLERLAAALPAEPRWDALRAEILQLEGGDAAVEERLQALDEAALDRLEAELETEEAAEVDQELDEALNRLRSRLPAAELEAARSRLRRDLLRRRAALPLLSLFSPVAEQEAVE
jgi:hypothetical protein